MKVIGRIDPATVAPERFRARCESCQWLSQRSVFVDTARTLGTMHARETSHPVVIEEEE